MTKSITNKTTKTPKSVAAYDSIVKGSELDKVLKGVEKNPNITAVELKKKIRFQYPPMRALKKLLKAGMVIKDRKTKTYTAK